MFVIYYKKCVESLATEELDIIIELQSKGYKTEITIIGYQIANPMLENVCILAKFKII
jgi:hypothetical protein